MAGPRDASLDQSRYAYFDRLAEEWDRNVNREELARRLSEQIHVLPLKPGERILDLGCGTGNLTRILSDLAPTGCRLAAVDVSRGMLLRVRKKVPGCRHVLLIQADAARLPFPDNSFEHIFCYSTWPHLDHLTQLEIELARLLVSRGHLYIWHSLSRNEVNLIHQLAGPPIAHDMLPPAQVLAGRLERAGFFIETCCEDERQYLVFARKESGND
ncbi:MAG TPA: class I SAM-dependent methyltransferase [Acidobacteriota bacterium]|jgi:demethylmenaquinone methyltransferase/2-methoxy-6-polyprenyl-1,4-benzoquinol methylase|nr:class I SAM-dependent methyltransferase [Acidobacteriota bacterium]HRR25326.1 class I SAM-dependent methyltransferase [Acidobacteriota bacterium]HRR55497.1 class I SAM-dependent methyltransferase [Acidobacteriota bacterium]HRV07248.1 class I SAM-dependent methyltransferase [Acidobacteriota bacterium]